MIVSIKRNIITSVPITILISVTAFNWCCCLTLSNCYNNDTACTNTIISSVNNGSTSSTQDIQSTSVNYTPGTEGPPPSTFDQPTESSSVPHENIADIDSFKDKLFTLPYPMFIGIILIFLLLGLIIIGLIIGLCIIQKEGPLQYSYINSKSVNTVTSSNLSNKDTSTMTTRSGLESSSLATKRSGLESRVQQTKRSAISASDLTRATINSDTSDLSTMSKEIASAKTFPFVESSTSISTLDASNFDVLKHKIGRSKG